MPEITSDKRCPLKKAIGDKLRALKAEDPDKLIQALIDMDMTPQEALEMAHDPEYWCRDNQHIDLSQEATTIMLLSGRGFGKDLSYNTDILTYNRGWIKLSEIKLGDYVYAWDGTPTKVIDFYDPEPRQLVEFTFSDGTSLISSVEHDWVTWTHQTRKCFNRNIKGSSLPDDWPNWSYENIDQWGNTRGVIKPEKRTSQDIIDTFTHGKRKDKNHSIPIAPPLEGVFDEGLVDCYYVGYWLGDGSSSTPHSLACGEEDRDWLLKNWPEFEDKGNCIFRSPAGSKEDIANLGLRNNKHIPERLLKMSADQRLDLLRGLMDSDGYADSSHVEFCSTNKRLAEGVLSLARTLGQKPRMYIGRATLRGKDCGEKYRVCWRPTYGINPFKLPRKANKITFGGKQESRNYHRMIVDFKYVEHQPTRCISVDHKDHLFLAGKGLIPTHNTFAGMYTLYRAVEKHGVKKILLLARTARDIRSTIVPAIEDMYYEGHPNYPHWSMAKSTIVWPNGAEAICIAAEAGSSAVRGINSALIIADEMAFYENNEDIIDMAFFTLRHSPSKFIGLTSPNATPKIMEMYEAWKNGDKTISVQSGSTYDNKENLSKGFMDNIVRSYEGTSLAAAELHGELVLQNKDALWNMNTIDRNLLKVPSLPDEWDHVTLGCDPAILSQKGGLSKKNRRKPDSTGLVVSGVSGDSPVITIDNHSGNYTTEQWALKLCELYDYWKTVSKKVSIYIESNTLGEDNIHMIFRNIERMDVHRHVKCEFSTQSKMARMQPFSLLAEQDKIKYADKASLQPLFRELTTYTGTGKSPDVADAAVFSWMLLKPKKKHFTSTSELML